MGCYVTGKYVLTIGDNLYSGRFA